MTVSDRRFELDKAFTYRALQDARQYVTDFDPTGRKAEVLYQRLARASRLMQPWSTDGAAHQASKANEYLREITSILSDKIGPASRREFRDQGGTRHATKKTSSAQLNREVNAALAAPSDGHGQGQWFYGLRIVPSDHAGYGPGKYVVQYKDVNGMWFDIGGPKSKADAQGALTRAQKLLVPRALRVVRAAPRAR